MRLSLTSSIRLTGYVALALCAVAVGLGRMTGPPAASRAPEREPWAGLCDIPGVPEPSPRFLGLETGGVRTLPLPEDEKLAFASASPWRDERGESQVVGLWLRLSGRSADRVAQEFGLARFSLPGGRPLDRIATMILPNSPPCWFPGTSSRILFTTGDGRLYRLAFEADGEAGEGRGTRPEEVPWAITPPGGGPVVVADPSWPRGPGMAGKVLVSLARREGEGRQARMGPCRIWWLQLDPSGSRIVGAGRITGPGEATADELSPALAAMPDGAPALAYLVRPHGGSKRQLHLLPIEVDERGLPRAGAGRAVVLDEGCRPSAPAFSPDGRWLAYVPNGPDSPRPRRVALPGPLGGHRRVALR